MVKELTQSQGNLLLKMAREAIAEKVSAEKMPIDRQGLKGKAKDLEGSDDSGAMDQDFLRRKQGVFVTLHKEGKLRGCIGTIEPVSAVGKAVRENARFAAFRDTRFPPLTAGEFDRIDIEVSILSVPKPMVFTGHEELIAGLTPYRDGVVLKKGACKATFLPQVWDQLPTAQEFLSQLCLKAGLSGNAWKEEDLEIQVYRVQSFGELQP